MRARLIHEIGTVIYLRRYRAGPWSGKPASPCPLVPGEYSYHQARVEVARTDQPREKLLAESGKGSYADDPRWPTHCACGYAFADDDEWQVMPERLYDTESGEQEPGDLYWATWGGLSKDKRKWEEGIPHLHGVCPNGVHWDIDGPSSNGNGWTRTGEPPNITASPSILVPGYHGFLQNGEWTPDLDGHAYP